MKFYVAERTWSQRRHFQSWVGRYTTSLWVQSPYCELQLQIFTRKKQSSANLSEKICQYCTYLSRWKLKFQLWLWPTLYRWLVLWFESKSCIQFNKHWLRPWWFAIGISEFPCAPVGKLFTLLWLMQVWTTTGTNREMEYIEHASFVEFYGLELAKPISLHTKFWFFKSNNILTLYKCQWFGCLFWNG